MTEEITPNSPLLVRARLWAVPENDKDSIVVPSGIYNELVAALSSHPAPGVMGEDALIAEVTRMLDEAWGVPMAMLAADIVALAKNTPPMGESSTSKDEVGQTPLVSSPTPDAVTAVAEAIWKSMHLAAEGFENVVPGYKDLLFRTAQAAIAAYQPFIHSRIKTCQPYNKDGANLTGTISDVHVYDKALTPEEIVKRYNPQREKDDFRHQINVIFNEIDCRIEHGVNSNGHLEAIHSMMRKAFTAERGE